MNTALGVWIQYLACAAAILVAGTYLSKYGDAVADMTGLGRTWIGVILMASVTSLPELITGVSSVTVFDVPDIAVGDILGACMINLVLIAVVDALCRNRPATSLAAPGHVLSAAFGGLLLGVIALSILADPYLPAIGWIGVTSLLVIALYVLAMRLIFRYERQHGVQGITSDENELGTPRDTRKVYLWFTLNALAIVAVAAYLPYVGTQLATVTGLDTTFVGNLFIALSTSLPEVVVSVAAVRIGAIDLAFGNLLGSNMINVAFLGVDDVFFRAGVLLVDITRIQLLIAVAVMTMCTIVAIGLTYRAEKKRWLLSWDAIGLVVVYVSALILLQIST
jgi:cation:H+ antiporter